MMSILPGGLWFSCVFLEPVINAIHFPAIKSFSPLYWHVSCPQGAARLCMMSESPWFSSIMTSSNGNIFRVKMPFVREFPSQRPVTRNFNVFFDLRPNLRLSKHAQGCWFETPSCPLWRHCNETAGTSVRVGGIELIVSTRYLIFISSL